MRRSWSLSIRPLSRVQYRSEPFDVVIAQRLRFLPIPFDLFSQLDGVLEQLVIGRRGPVGAIYGTQFMTDVPPRSKQIDLIDLVVCCPP